MKLLLALLLLLLLKLPSCLSLRTLAKGACSFHLFITDLTRSRYITVEDHAGDRNHLDPWHNGNALVQAVARTNTPTIVVVHSVGPITLETILAEPNVVAIVWAGLPGQESGHALVDVLFGDLSPSGKLPYTIGKSEKDYGATWTTELTDNFSEGLFIDYRHFDQNEIQPRYEFGFGLCMSLECLRGCD